MLRRKRKKFEIKSLLHIDAAPSRLQVAVLGKRLTASELKEMNSRVACGNRCPPQVLRETRAVSNSNLRRLQRHRMHPYYLEPRDLRNSVQHMVNERISNNKKTVLGAPWISSDPHT